MILFELCGGTETHTVYRQQHLANLNRSLDFLKSLVGAALATESLYLSQTVIKALNFHALACLHDYAGVYRPCDVTVGSGDSAYFLPSHHRVSSLMDEFVNGVNRRWESLNSVQLASFVLWKLNQIHPFVNGNGRTARAACYFVLCLKLEVWLPGSPILAILLQQHRQEYVSALKTADEYGSLQELTDLITRLLSIQLEDFRPET